MPTITELEWQTMSRVLEEVRTPYHFVTQLLFNNFNTNPTENIAIDSWVAGRLMAPFVTPGAGAQLITGMSTRQSIVTAPSIRAKRPFTARQLLTARVPGSPVFANDGSPVLSAAAKRVAHDLKYAREQIDQTLEWMCCQVLTGTLTYNIALTDGQLGDSFTIDYGRPAGHTVTLTSNDTWDTALASATSLPRQHVTAVKELISDTVGLAPTDCIMGSAAADAWIANESIREDLDNRRIVPGSMTLVEQFRQSGAIFLGEVYGIRWWRYARSVSDPFGTATLLVAADAAHFVAATPGAENVVEYGAIQDLEAAEQGMLETRFFSKSWRQKDPSADMYLWESRPLPVARRPESMVTYIVV